MATRKGERQEPAKLAYSIDALAEAAGLGRDAIYAAIRDGRLKAKKYGRRTLITAAASHEFLDNLPDLMLPGPEAEPADGPQSELPAPRRKRRLKAPAPPVDGHARP